MAKETDLHEAAGHAAEATPFFQDPSTWAGIGLIIFLGILLWKKVPAVITKSLDDRADGIQSELDNAAALRKEAEEKLADAKKRQAEAENDAKEIVEAAKREANQLAAKASEDLQESIARRQKMAEERIARAEAEAIRDVKTAAVETASKAAEQVLVDAMATKSGDEHFAASLEAVKKALQ